MALAPPIVKPVVRPLRADARRNRDKILAAARAAFTDAGATVGEAVSLEAVARDAGVGIGTLYRNFPTREALVEAVHGAALDDLVDRASTVLQEGVSAVDALRRWMHDYAAFVVTKHGMVDTLRAGWAPEQSAATVLRDQLTGAVAVLLAAGAAAGEIRADVHAEDVVALLLGVSLSSLNHTDQAPTRRRLDLIVDAVRARA